MFRRKAKEAESSFLDLYDAPLEPSPFLHYRLPCQKARDFPLTEKHILPNLTYLGQSEYSIPVYMGWSFEGIYFTFAFDRTQFLVEPANIGQGDAIELFFATRDNKNLTYIGRFCHHFVIYPEKVGGMYGKEVTRFRGDEAHDLANPHEIQVSINQDKDLELFLPSHCLYGFDPSQFKRLGFTYQIHQEGEEIQQFTLCDYPHHFASMELI